MLYPHGEDSTPPEIWEASELLNSPIFFDRQRRKLVRPRANSFIDAPVDSMIDAPDVTMCWTRCSSGYGSVSIIDALSAVTNVYWYGSPEAWFRLSVFEVTSFCERLWSFKRHARVPDSLIREWKVPFESRSMRETAVRFDQLCSFVTNIEKFYRLS